MEKLVYTRCNPSILITQAGKLQKSEGYGVAAISKDFFMNTNGVDYVLLDKMVREDKGEVKIIDKFYEYAEVGNGNYFLNASSHLPLCTEARKNGKTHRPVFLADALVGKFSIRPASILLDENFLEHNINQNDFYPGDNGNDPMVLSSVNESDLKINNDYSGINLKSAKTLLAFLLKNLSLALEKQEAVIIADNNANVIKLLRLVESAIPVKIANKITFITQSLKLSGRDVERYVYYTKQGNLIGDYNTVETEIKPFRRVKYMVSGFSNGMLLRNDASEYQVIYSNGDTSIKINIPNYVNDIIDGNENAKKFLEYIETKLNGEISDDIDNLYNLFKDVSNIDSFNDYQSIYDVMYKFNQSIFLNEQGFSTLIKENLANKYANFALEDALNNFKMLNLIKVMDVNLSSRLLTQCYQIITKGFDIIPVDLKSLRAYQNLKEAGYANDEVENDMIKKHISTKGLSSLIGKDESLVNLYYSLYKKANIKIKEEEKELIAKMLKQYLSSNNSLKDEIINLVNVHTEFKDDLLIKMINQTALEGDNVLLENLFALYKPEIKKEDIKFEVARLAKDTIAFSKYEKEYIDKLNSNPSKIDEIFSDLMKMSEIYVECQNNPMDMLRFLTAFLDSFKASDNNAPINKAIEISEKILLFKKTNDMQTLKLIINKLESKSLMYSLQNLNNRPDADKLDSLGASSLKKYLTMENKVLNAPNGEKQIEALKEFMSVRIDLKVEHLELAAITRLIKALKYQNCPVHIYFYECFQNFDNATAYINKYLEILMSVKGYDNIALYHSLVLSTLEETNNDKTRKMMKALESLINQEESDLMKECFDKKYQKELDTYPLNNDKEKKAMEIVKGKYQAWDESHKGFFARLFGKNK